MRPNASCSDLEEAPPRLASVRVALRASFSPPRFVTLGPRALIVTFRFRKSPYHLFIFGSPRLYSASLVTSEAFTVRFNIALIMHFGEGSGPQPLQPRIA